jgi:hypothetical protein
VKVIPVRAKKNQPRHRTVMLENVGGSPLEGPLYLLLDRLGRKVKLRNATGFSQTHVHARDPYRMLSLDQLAPGQAVLVDLVFSNTPIHFNTIVLAGPGIV